MGERSLESASKKQQASKSPLQFFRLTPDRSPTEVYARLSEARRGEEHFSRSRFNSDDHCFGTANRRKSGSDSFPVKKDDHVPSKSEPRAIQFTAVLIPLK